jgi:hypothetical protein
MKSTKNYFICPYCDKEYESPTDYAKCILDCDAKIKQEAEDRKRAELELEKDKRRKEIEEVRQRLFELEKAFLKDYGSLTVSGTYYTDDLINTLPRFLGEFWH